MKLSKPDEPETTDVSSWEVLAVHLHVLTRALSEKGHVVSDEMLQKHARLVVYGSSETQALTAADNSEWLDLFKKAHSLDIIPDFIGGEAECIPEDLEVYQDLGLRMPSSLRKQRQGAMVALFLSDKPPLKNYVRFSSLVVPSEKALHFETIAAPWPEAGKLGTIVVTRNWLLQGSLEAQVGRSFQEGDNLWSGDGERRSDEPAVTVPQERYWTESMIPHDVLASFRANEDG